MLRPSVLSLSQPSAVFGLSAVGLIAMLRFRKTSQAQEDKPSIEALDIKHCDYIINYKNEALKNEGICHVCKALCDWQDTLDSHLTVKTISGGITNLLFLVHNSETKESVLVRIYGEATEIMIDRNMDVKLFHILSKKKFGPHLYGTFDNGRIEGYFEAKPLESDSLGERYPVDYPKLIGRELAIMHSLDINVDRKPQLWVLIDKFSKMAASQNYYKANREHLIPKYEELVIKYMLDELKWIKTKLPSSENRYGADIIANLVHQNGADCVEALVLKFLTQSVFSHNDLLGGNMLYVGNADSSQDRVQFIDFEYGCYNFRAFDMANHFCEYAGFDFDLKRWYPSEESQVHFYEAYIENCNFDPGLTPGNKKEFMLHMCNWVNKFALASNLLWGFWAVIQSCNSPIDFDFIGYAALRFNGYKYQKQQFF